MRQDEDFEKMIRDGYTMVSVEVLYYMPDCKLLVNSFFWQTLDLTPKYPRVHRFLNYWKKEIDAVIKEITVCDHPYLESNKYNSPVIFNIANNRR